MIAPIYKELSEEFGSRANFIKVDVDDNPEAAQKYGVSAMPTFLFVKGGEVVDRLMGANSDRLKEVGSFHDLIECFGLLNMPINCLTLALLILFYPFPVGNEDD